MKLGARVIIVHCPAGNTDFKALQDARGIVVEISPPQIDDKLQRGRFKVMFDEPLGPRGITSFFPLYAENLKVLSD